VTSFHVFGDLDIQERSGVVKLLNFSLLSPRIVEAVVVGKKPDGLSVAKMRGGVAMAWGE